MLRTVYHRAFIFHKQNGLGEDKNPFDFGFTRSKVKVTRVTFVKKLIMFSNYYPEKYLSHIFHISHADWSWCEHVMY